MTVNVEWKLKEKEEPKGNPMGKPDQKFVK